MAFDPKAWGKSYREANKVRLKAYREANRDRTNARRKAYREANRQKTRASAKAYYTANREKIMARQKRHNQTIREKINAGQRAWRQKNRERSRAYHRAWQKTHRRSGKYLINSRMSASINRSLRQYGGKRRQSWEKLVGYTASELKTALENAFTAGMNWARFLDGQIHIDHIIPKAKFSYTSADDPEFKRCWALENLQPKWAKHNLSKQTKLEGPSQIPLGI